MGSTESSNKGPSIAELQRFVRDKVRLEFLLSNGDRLVGTLKWFDEEAFSVISEDDSPITLLRLAVLAYRPCK